VAPSLRSSVSTASFSTISDQTYGPRICLRPVLHPYPGSTNARAELPSCVTPLLAYYWSGSRDPPACPEGLTSFLRLASPDSAWACCRENLSLYETIFQISKGIKCCVV
jgi:hypothetical protein